MPRQPPREMKKPLQDLSFFTTPKQPPRLYSARPNVFRSEYLSPSQYCRPRRMPQRLYWHPITRKMHSFRTRSLRKIRSSAKGRTSKRPQVRLSQTRLGQTGRGSPRLETSRRYPDPATRCADVAAVPACPAPLVVAGENYGAPRMLRITMGAICPRVTGLLSQYVVAVQPVQKPRSRIFCMNLKKG